MNFSVSYMLQRLGFSGTDAIVVLAERGLVTALRCAMPVCYCPGGRGFFERIGSSTPDDYWTPSQDHYQVLKEQGGLLVPENVRLAHKRCNGFDYGRSESHDSMRAAASKRRIDESALEGSDARWSEVRRTAHPENAPDFNADPSGRYGVPSLGPIHRAGEDQTT